MSIFDPAPVRKLKAAVSAPQLPEVYDFQQKINDFLASNPADTTKNERLARESMKRLNSTSLLSPLAFIHFTADMIRTHNCTPVIKSVLENHLTASAWNLNKSMPNQKPAFALLYSCFFNADEPAQTSFAACAAEFLGNQHPDQGMTPAFEMYGKIQDQTAAKVQVMQYVISHYREAVSSHGIGATIDLLMTAKQAMPNAYVTQDARKAVAAIIVANPNGVMEADRPADWPLKAALWSLDRPSHPDEYEKVLEILTKAWLPDYGNSEGLAAVEPYYKTLMRAYSSLEPVRTEISAYMLPRLDSLAAVTQDISPAIEWAHRIGADHPEVMSFTAKHLLTLLARPTNDFDDLAKPLPKETLAAVEPLLPQEQRVRLQNFLTPPQPYQRCGVHIVE